MTMPQLFNTLSYSMLYCAQYLLSKNLTDLLTSLTDEMTILTRFLNTFICDLTACNRKLTGSPQPEKSIVIQIYLQGKSMNQIANETGISKGKVHYLLADWKKKIAIPDIDGIIDFIVLVRKSNMSIQQCAQGFRMTNMLRDLGIQDDNSVYDDDNNGDIGNNQYNELSTFIENIYLNCKNLGVTPANIFSWIEDLLEFHPDTNSTDVNNSSSSSSLIDNDDNMFYKKPITPDSLQAENKTSYKTKSNLDNNYNSSIKLKDDSQGQNKIPFTSEISHYISQKKKEYKKLENYKKELEKNIKIEESKIKKIEFELEQLKQDKKYVVTFIDWFYDLKRKLLENYDIKIENDIQGFSQLINDFKEHGYNAAEIIKEYLRSLSIKLEIKTYDANIRSLQNQINDLTNSLAHWESQVNQHKQAIDIHHQLEVMGFGFKAIKQLWNTILEISDANKIPYDEAVSKFFKDVEEQYDTKLGFESKVQEKKNEILILKNQLNTDRLALQSTPYIVPSLQNLFQNGVTEEDIINMNYLVTKLAKNSFPLNLQNNNGDNTPITKDTNDNNLIINNKKFDRTKVWKSFIIQLEKLQDITIEIKKHMEFHNKIQKEVDELNKQKQEISIQCQIAITLINTIKNKISYIKGFMDHYKDFHDKTTLPSRYSSVPVFIIVNKITGKEKEDDDDDDKNKEG
jgi:predicted acetyltransferase